jgi:hypothetical protein
LEKGSSPDRFFIKLENRWAKRYPVSIKARYLQKGKSGWAECEVIDISRRGIGIKLPPIENISEDSEICVEIYLKEQLDPIHVQGTIKWICKVEDGLVSGVALLRPFDHKILDYIIPKASSCSG